VTGEITVGDIEIFFERIKIEGIVVGQGRHDAEPDPAFKCFM
jgi:hypothetical protein